MATPTTNSLYSFIRNISGSTRFFGYFGRHGVNLAAGASYGVFGFIQHAMGYPGGGKSKRYKDHFEAALLNGTIEILSTPAPIFYDASPPSDTIAAPTVAATVSITGGGSAQVANPSTQATVSVTGGGSTGGFLAAGTYFLAYTYTNAAGETTGGSSESTSFTVAAGNKPQATIGAIPSGCKANVYLTAPGGAAGSEVLYASGLTSTTVNLYVVAPTSTVTVPTTNTTAGTLAAGQYYVSYTFVTAQGETTPGTSESTQTAAVTLGNIPSVTLPAISGTVTGLNLYVSPPGGASGSEVLYATNITTTTAYLPTAVNPLARPLPTVNSTAAHTVLAANVANATLGLVDPSWGSYEG